MNTRTPRPCNRAGRNSAFSTQSLVGWSNAGLGLFMIFTDAGSTRPVVSITARRITRPEFPPVSEAGGTRGVGQTAVLAAPPPGLPHTPHLRSQRFHLPGRLRCLSPNSPWDRSAAAIHRWNVGGDLRRYGNRLEPPERVHQLDRGWVG